MLVHKRTLGVLEATWDGAFRTIDGVRVPVLRPARLDALGLDPAEWWEVADGSALAFTIRRCWPWFDPVVGQDGALLGAEPWPGWRVYGETPPVPLPPPAQRRRRRRIGLKLG